MRRLLAALRGYCTLCGRGFTGSTCPNCGT